MARTFAVFTGSSLGADPRFAQGAADLGCVLGRRGHGLVYGGARIGLMGVVADAALGAGAPVTGVLPDFMADREIAHEGLTALHRVPTMHARKALMADYYDPLLTWIRQAAEAGFVRPPHRDLLRAHTDPEALVRDLETWMPAAAVSKWDAR